MEFIIVTGLSGAGKSRAIAALEDVGYYCVDNMPPALLPKFFELCLHSKEKVQRAAIVIDVRGRHLFRGLTEALEELERQGGRCRVLFLECDMQTVARRYKETRRRHPLADLAGDSIFRAIELEKELLQPLRERASYVIDTTLLSAAQLREQVVQRFSDDPAKSLTVRCLSFGFKYGYPSEADTVFDVRCFRNPFYEDDLREKTGLDAAVRDFVLETEHVGEFRDKLYDLLKLMLPLYEAEGKSEFVLAIGCTGGKHRSVTLVEDLARYLREQTGYAVRVGHRDIWKA